MSGLIHTPGPWDVHDGDYGPQILAQVPYADWVVEQGTAKAGELCTSAIATFDSDNAQADAFLASKAPELLVAAVALLDLHGWEPGPEWGEEERAIFQACMNLVGETTDTLCGGKIGERKVIADQANEALRGARGAAPVLSGVSTREDLIYWLGCVDRNGVWTDEDMVSEGWDPMTLDEAWEQVELMLDKGGE